MYLFTSDRLGFRNWKEEDLSDFAAMNADERVMEHFPATLTEEQSAASMLRMQEEYKKRGYTYFAVEERSSGLLIGFIGLFYQTFESPFNPAVDIGWRLQVDAWGKGYATEGAKRCLQYAFEHLSLDAVVACCTLSNTSSERVMQKIGMRKKGVFDHPYLKEQPTCVWYEIKKDAEPSSA